MISKITAVPDDILPSLSDIVQPLSSKSLFWQATYLKGGATTEILPFLFWIVESSAPRVLVSLDQSPGEAYLALCQAVSRLAMESRCFNISVASSAEAVDAHNREYYEDFSILLNEPPHEAAERFAEQSVDLLYLDLSNLPGNLGFWADRLSPRSTVLIHGVCTPGMNEKRRVCLEQLRIKALDFTLEHGAGLGLVVGPEAPSRIKRLSQLQLGVPGYSEVQKVFFRLGKAHRNAYLARHEQEERTRQQEELAALHRQYDAQTSALETLRQQQAEWQQAKESHAEEAEKRGAQHRADLETLKAAVAAAQTEGEESAKALAEASRRLHGTEVLQKHLSEAQRNLRESQIEIKTLKETLERQNRKLAKFDESGSETINSKFEWLRGEVSKYKKAVETVEESLAEKTRKSEAAIAERDTRITELQVEVDQLIEERDQSRSALEERIDELVTLTRLFETEKAQNAKARANQQQLHEIRVELRDAEINMLRQSRSRLGRGDAPSRAGLPTLKTQAETLRKSRLFDADWYLATYPDVAESKVDPVQHYLNHGALDGRNPGPAFDTMAYYRANRDVASRGFNALVHYELFGREENRPLNKEAGA